MLHIPSALFQNVFCSALQKLTEENLNAFKVAFIKKYPDYSNLLDLVSIIAFDTDFNEYFYCGKDCNWPLCHGNLWNKNIFLKDDECILIDWQCASVGCPLGDIATLVTFGIDIGPEPSKCFELFVQYYLDFLKENSETESALREMFEQPMVPLMLSVKMQKKSLQFAVKWVLFCFDGFVNAHTYLYTRVMRDIYYILEEMAK